MDSMSQFKKQIESMFQHSFGELQQKNSLNRTILSNLVDAANEQTKKINELDHEIENVRRSSQPQTTLLKRQIQKKDQSITDNFDRMMYRLSQIEEGINCSRNNMEHNLRVNLQSQESMGKLLNKMKKIEKEENIPEYMGSKEQLYNEIEQFQRVLLQENGRAMRVASGIDFEKKMIVEPLNTFQTQIAMHNKANEDILRDKIRGFTDKIRSLQKKVQETAYILNSDIQKSNEQQKRIVEEMGSMQNEIIKLRLDLDHSDANRRQQMQAKANSLDNMVEDMLSEAKKLQIRVQALRKGYEDENEKLNRNTQQRY